MKNIYLLGATGSIGTQTLDVIRMHPEAFRLIAFSSGRNIELTKQIIEEFQPAYVSVMEEESVMTLEALYPNVEFGYGAQGLESVATYQTDLGGEDFVVTAVMGSVGLLPTLKAIEMGRNIGIANKETLVTAGHLVMEKAKQHGVKLLPVDSEHSAIYQCLQGEDAKAIKKLIITASGGSFRDYTREMLKEVTLEQALNHPNWSMGAKITIDSATMMNKGLEVIEAHWLFDMPYERIETILHRQSIIHSMVEFEDTSIIAHLGTPDMRIPIQFAMSYPERMDLKQGKSLNLAEVGTLEFKPMDFERFPCLKMAYEAGMQGGSCPTVLNAANEAAVDLFLRNKISFLEIETVVAEALNKHQKIDHPSLEQILQLDQEVRRDILAKYE
ncbi:1-deoxy-D-xylulose-5-phosphate reductoisomerase [Turicibacter sanguinis]|uniref:1-deoxy-D-xylulose-5-phosphate reductoisomerase n=2 Tax=Turicibacteraceae TaxID=2810281 RepID=UPI0001FD9CF6|nr:MULTISPECIES: 1-deoxy-D-xylulose-5-phosphate reductoisomerase [Turicibacter]EGC92595.1 1-deoxy-D-xylulose 5-phosphate reductoisomerase [Turicibacter sp. HGF1]MCU7196138.1 1-deoxy-D-xylulose-5-phosphate reductoisomerase [Turicibacter sanguinis]MDB8552087.1 1-deoxy-D-xylulose-5-phosphate reductoisomerase [Turicibacter sanguinis]MDB8566729.1 1-deoxy-D-xylulose-5-phosphate reductoisomerase [Turicibacter sanguinis]MDB8569366.1 1-deoxy-D-xylulose-5-phosphate reductoisomerase [Turicibacter sanguin